MKRMSGGSEAQPGFYFRTADWQIVAIEKGPQALPGGPGQAYVRVPAVGMLVLAPLLGLSFVVFLPFVGFALVARQVGRKMMKGARTVGTRLWPEEAERPSGTGRVVGERTERTARRFRS